MARRDGRASGLTSAVWSTRTGCLEEIAFLCCIGLFEACDRLCRSKSDRAVHLRTYGDVGRQKQVRRHACTRWTTSQAEFLVASSVAYVDSDMVPCSLAALPCLVDKVVVAVLRRSMAPDFRDRLHGRCVRGHNCRHLCFSGSPSGLRNGVVACQCPQHAGCVVDLSRRSQSSFIALTTGQAQLFPSERPRRDRIVRRPRSAEDLRRMGYVARGVQDRRTS